VRQSTGWLRYRIATPARATFGIETPFLDLVVDDAVLDVTVGERETEVAVVSGRVLVKTSDGRRQIDLDAGHTGYASLEGEPLAVRRGPGGQTEPVPAIVLPALHPDRAAGAQAAPDPAGPAATAEPPAATTAVVAQRPAPRAAAYLAQPAPDEALPTEPMRPFDRLTEGLLDGVRPALPAAQRDPR